MLCPKCGYITFDELPACPKCKKDWAEIAAKIRGIGAVSEAPLFLRKVLKNQEPEEDADTAEEMADEEDESLEQGLDELAAMDESHEEILEIEEESPEALEEPSAGGGMDGSIDFVLPEMGLKTPPAEKPEEFELSLDGAESDDGDASSPLPVDDEPGDTGGQLLADLHNIDLSDLVAPGASPGEEGGAPKGRGPDEQEEILDLSSLDDDRFAPDFSGIDLSLEEGEPVDLTLDIEKGPPGMGKKKEKPTIPDLGLSLDLDE